MNVYFNFDVKIAETSEPGPINGGIQTLETVQKRLDYRRVFEPEIEPNFSYYICASVRKLDDFWSE